MKFEDGSFFKFPDTRWSFSNLREFLPVRLVPRGAAFGELPRMENADIDALQFVPMNSAEPMTWAQSLQANYTDGILVLHKGRVIYERYPGALTAAGQHIAFSVTKSFVATIAASLISEGAVNETAAVLKYVPELAGSGLADATIRE